MTVDTAIRGTFLQCTGRILPPTYGVSQLQKTMQARGYNHYHVVVVWGATSFDVVFDSFDNTDGEMIGYKPRYVDDSYDYGQEV